MYELTLVSEDVFDPFIKSEFFDSGDEQFRNMFRPTSYMELESKKHEEPRTILTLMRHLTRNIDERFIWFINWFAFYFQLLRKSPVALVLKGDQGAGKGVFWTKVVVPLFGKKQCIQINDETFKGKYLGSIIEGRLYYNLDEISQGMKDNKTVKNKLKALISNESLTVEKKYDNTEQETDLFGQVMITTNEPQSLEIEHRDRRFSVFEKTNYLGLGSYRAFITQIEAELEDFALYLKDYEVDVKMATTAMNTREKEALVGATNDRFLTFANAIITKNIDYFEELATLDGRLYHELKNGFEEFRVNKSNLQYYFGTLENEKISTSKLLKRLKTINSDIFDNQNTTGLQDGTRFFLLDGHPKREQGAEVEQVEPQPTEPAPLTFPVMPQPPQPSNNTLPIPGAQYA